MRVADACLQILEKFGITQTFLITGGFAMHLNDALYHNKNFKVLTMHHEQALGYAALGYVKATHKPALVQVTSGCGATNCLTPLVDAWQDNLPIIFISGNTQSKNTIRYNRIHNNYNSRHISGADIDIVEMVKNITKFAEEIYSAEEVPRIMVEAIKEAISGRPGPVWISLPLDIQGSQIDFDINQVDISLRQISTVDHRQIDLSRFSRPLILAGQGLRNAKCISKFKNFIERHQIPFVATFLSVDILPDDHPLYQGRIGVVGERCGNFTVSNCDCLIVLGSRLASTVVGYVPEWFARGAFKIVVDIDSNEHQKKSIHIDSFLEMDLNNFFEMDILFSEIESRRFWLQKCESWKAKWFMDEPPNVEDDSQGINPYFVMRQLSNYSPLDTIFTHTAGSIVNITWHRLRMLGSRRFLNAASGGDMGEELPASIGSYLAYPELHHCSLNGDGSFQFNIQELQTVRFNNFPIVIIVLNNLGYSAIKMTQKNFFQGNYIGVDKDSGVSFPSLEKVAGSYKIKYYKIVTNQELSKEFIEEIFSLREPVIVEIMVSDQERYPKLAAKKMENGSFKSQPFENMYPFLPEEEIAQEMLISRLDPS